MIKKYIVNLALGALSLVVIGALLTLCVAIIYGLSDQGAVLAVFPLIAPFILTDLVPISIPIINWVVFIAVIIITFYYWFCAGLLTSRLIKRIRSKR